MATIPIRSNLAQACRFCIGIQNPAYRSTWPSSQGDPASDSFSLARILELLAAHQLARSVHPDGPPGWYVGGMADPFQAYENELQLRDLDPKTRLRYGQVTGSYQRWLGGRDVNPETAKEFLAYLRLRGYRPASISLYYTCLRMFLDFLGLKLQLKIRKPKVLPPVYDPRDIELLLQEANQGLPRQSEAVRRRNHDVIAILIDTGLRIGELVELRVGDIDFNQAVLVVRHGKGQKQRAIPLTARASIALRRRTQGKGAQHRVIEGVNRRNLYMAIAKLARRIGLEGLHPHSQRHYFGTQLAERGVRLEAIQDLMGHADPSTTRVYVAVTGRALREAISALERPTDGDKLLQAPCDGGAGVSNPWELPRF